LLLVGIGAYALPIALTDSGNLRAGSTNKVTVGLNEVLSVVIIHAPIDR
jgi:hypothetical protein